MPGLVSAFAVAAMIAVFSGFAVGAPVFDWGDAPDMQGRYPTLSASNGAFHRIMPGVHLGPSVDAETDGQPQIHALGDDNDGHDDEDGVIFTSPVAVGLDATLRVEASVDGFLNAWVDFNRDGNWQADEQVFTDEPLISGFNWLAFAVPARAMPGATCARFRFTTQAVADMSPVGGAENGEVEDYILEIEKGPVNHKMHWAQLPDPDGWDVRGYTPKILADDFRCTESGMITRITFWGSWRKDEVGEFEHVHLSIHADDRSGEFSKPGKLLWRWDIPGDAVRIEPAGQGRQGWFDPNTGEFIEDDHKQFFEYTVQVPIDEAFVQQEGMIYWLDIQVDVAGKDEWGWKTSRSAHFEDDAVWDDTPQDEPRWRELADPITHESLDMAFVIAGIGFASLGDRVWDDANGNGIQELGEPGHPGVTVNLYDAANVPVASAVTNAAGEYRFDHLLPGTYEIEFIRPVGSMFTAQNQGADDAIDSDADPAGRTGPIVLAPGHSDMAWDAGLVDLSPVQYDWGDAPDDPSTPVDYPTLKSSLGAYHLIVPGIHLGSGVDPELDGQPQIHALGDDNDGNDDEDGVIFTSPIVVGGVATLQVDASVHGYLNAWLDIDRDGDWKHPTEQIFANQPLAPGPNSLTFTVPANASPGTTYARFRFTSRPVPGLSPSDSAPDGEVEDYILEIEEDPVEHKMHWAQLPDPLGWDVRGFEPKILADDFRCTESGPITRVIFWGSWREDKVGELVHVHLSIHTDDRTGRFSKPGKLLWHWDVPGDAVQIEKAGEGKQGWFDPNTGEFIEGDHEKFFKYIVDIPAGEAFSQEEGMIYWLDIQVVSREGEWGWKTSRSAHFEDDAVWDDTPQEQVNWNELVDPVTGESLDMAFVISGWEEPPAIDWGDAPDDAANANDYPTLASSNGASHLIATDVSGVTICLGGTVDAEPDGQPTMPADGDDVNPPLGIDDEDGVTFSTALIPGVSAVVNVTASTAGHLNAWIDYNGDGDWADGGEYVFADLSISAGTTPLVFVVPTTAVAGGTYARFRFTAASLPAGVDYSGQAPDGEVEDYRVRIEEPVELDWGDALDAPYPTTILSNGARHVIVPGYHMGALIDGEPDGQPDLNAMGDDNNNLDDEDGVFFYPLIPGQGSAIDVSLPASSGAGFVDAWIDFNGNGSWLDPGEQIAVSVPVAPGVNQVTFPVPAGISAATTFARVRFSSTGGLFPTGPAPDGEVEDYQVQILPAGEPVFDYGDAPDMPYPTLHASGGAAHVLGGPMLGAFVDAEPDGQPGPQALGDDLNIIYPGGPDDEDGVNFPYPLVAGMGNVVEVTASVPGIVDAWVDFSRDGDWADTGEQILTSVPVVAGVNIIAINVPAQVKPGPTVSRFRISTAGGLAPTGFAPDGEVEDHLVDVYGETVLDWGDAPDPSYPTLLANFGAAHMIDALFLGNLIDAEADGQPNATATGDDIANLPDEDGITMDPVISGSTGYMVIATSALGYIDGWIDFDGDGSWDQPGDHILTARPWSGAGYLFFTVPDGIGPVLSYARFRVGHDSAGLPPTGYAVGGEVEDYMVPIGKRIASAIQLDSLSAPTTVTLKWTAEPGATQYSIYSSTDLAAPFPQSWALEASGVAALTWSESFVAPAKFYIVVAFP